MMRLQPPAPKMSGAGQQATKKLYETYVYLTELYKTKKPGYQLRSGDLEKIDASLREHVVFGAELVERPVEGIIFQRKVEPVRRVGFGSGAFDSTLYASAEIKNALIASHHGRCAYCESYLRHVDHGDVEHFRPKAGVVEAESEGLNRDAYFWLAYEPSNLFLACKICNEVYKGNQFPVLEGGRLEPGEFKVAKERSVLINPYVEDPRDFIRFNPMNGKAYAFDLYAESLGGKEAAQALFWEDPSRIESIVQESSFHKFLEQAEDPTLKRGLETICLLALNRPELLRARVAHLRHLRALLWTSWHGATVSDVQHTGELLDQLLKSESVNLVPEYHSLAIDALYTWATRKGKGKEPRVALRVPNSVEMGIEADPWIPAYDKFLKEFEHKGTEDVAASTSTYNDAISYFVPDDKEERGRTDYRRLIYVTEKDKAYGVKEDEDGFYLAIDWKEDLEKVVKITKHLKGGDRIEKMQLKDFLKIDSKSLYRKFDKSEVTVEGPFEALFPS